MSDQRKPGKAELILATISTAVMAWSVMPPQERMWIKLAAATRARRLLARLAWREGHHGMGDELAGRDPWPRYGAALVLSRARDLIDKTLEAMRP